MAIQRRTRRRGEEELLDDEADIVEEGASENDENGEEAPDEEPVRKTNAVDSESARENRRRRRVVAKKKAREPGVPFETKDPLEKYDILLQSGHSATEIDISIKRISGGPGVQDFIVSRPGSGQALLEAVKTFHVQNGGMASEYWLKILDSHYKTILGQGRVAVPDMRPQGAMPMPYYPQPQAPAPPQTQQAVTAPAPQSQPEPQRNPLSDMEQAFDFFLRMTGRGQPQQPQQPQQPAQPQAPMPAMPGNMGEMLRMFEFFENRMRPPFPSQPQPQPAQPQPQQVQPAQPMGMPTFPAPAGTQWMYDPRGGWVAVPVAAQEPRGYRPRLQPEHEPSGPGLHRGQPGPFGPNGAPQRPRTAADMLRETMTTVRSAAEVMREFEEILPGSTGRMAGEEAPAQEDEDNPFRTQKIGEIDVLRDPEGEIAFWPSVAVNAPKAFKFLGETYEKLQKKAAEQRQQQQQQQQRRVLPPGHIEVIPGQPVQAPDGYVAVVLDEEEAQRVMQQQQQPVVTPAPAPQSALPPAPQDVPPPITAQPEQQPRSRSWGLPSIPEGE